MDGVSVETRSARKPGRSEGTRGGTVADQAWSLIFEIFMANKARVFAAAAEFDLSPMQIRALSQLEAGRPVPMSDLATALFCDASNVTGIVDRLEARGLIERRSAEHDRRVKLLHITPEGVRLRDLANERMSGAPPEIAALSAEDQRTLLSIFERALTRG
jgi:MarR family transcriptional regulator, organic hydroperoxide resistance regulator